MKEKKVTKLKKTYAKPQVKKIKLDNEVLLGGNCKEATGTVRSGSGPGCHTSGMPCVLSTQGS